jgi:hypothetical protein
MPLAVDHPGAIAAAFSGLVGPVQRQQDRTISIDFGQTLMDLNDALRTLIGCRY